MKINVVYQFTMPQIGRLIDGEKKVTWFDKYDLDAEERG